MNMHKETEDSAISANEFDSISDEEVRSQNQQNTVDFLIVTSIPQKTFNFQWIIRQFSTLSENKELFSTDIQVSPTSSYRLKLVKFEHGFRLFHVSKVESKESGVKSVNTRPGAAFGTQSFSFGPVTIREPIETVSGEPKEGSNTNDFIYRLDYQVSAFDNKGKELIKWSVCCSNDSEFSNCKIGEYINNTLEVFPDDLLILNCNLKVTLKPTGEEIPIASKPSLECNSWKKLSTDMKALYQNSLDTDVTLVIGTDKIEAHKLIPIARSAVFRKIFHNDMKEAEQNSVTITDVEFSTLQRLVEFLYTGMIAVGENEAMHLQELLELYYAADKYEIMDLKEMAGNTLLGRVQVDNACEILIWADRHNDNGLKSRIMNFIRVNFEDVSNTDAWESCVLHHSTLAIEVFSFCAKKTRKQ